MPPNQCFRSLTLALHTFEKFTSQLTAGPSAGCGIIFGAGHFCQAPRLTACSVCAPPRESGLDWVPCIYGAEHSKSDGCRFCSSTAEGCALLLRTPAHSRSEVPLCEILTGKAPPAQSRGRFPARSVQGTGTSGLQVGGTEASWQSREWARNCICSWAFQGPSPRERPGPRGPREAAPAFPTPRNSEE